MEGLISLRDLLVDVEKYSWKDSLFFSKEGEWSLDSNCAVLNMDDLEDDEEIPPFAFDNNLRYVLTIQEVQDVVKNIRLQNEDCSEEDLIKALLYYYKNDAFIVWF